MDRQVRLERFGQWPRLHHVSRRFGQNEKHYRKDRIWKCSRYHGTLHLIAFLWKKKEREKHTNKMTINNSKGSVLLFWNRIDIHTIVKFEWSYTTQTANPFVFWFSFSFFFNYRLIYTAGIEYPFSVFLFFSAVSSRCGDGIHLKERRVRGRLHRQVASWWSEKRVEKKQTNSPFFVHFFKNGCWSRGTRVSSGIPNCAVRCGRFSILDFLSSTATEHCQNRMKRKNKKWKRIANNSLMSIAVDWHRA